MMPTFDCVKSVPGHMLLREFPTKMIQTELQRLAGLAHKETDDGKAPDQDAVQAKDKLISQGRSILTCEILAYLVGTK